MGRRRKPSLLQVETHAALWLLTGAILCLILADVSYVDLDAVREIFRSKDILHAIWLTLLTSFITTVLSVLFAVPSAYALSRFPFRGLVILDVLVDLLMVVPVLVVGVSLLVFFRVGSDLGEIPFAPFQILGSWVAAAGRFFIYQQPGIVLAQFFCSVSFAVRAIKAAFDQIDSRTEHIAMTLGCTPTQAFFRATLPQAYPGIFAGAVLAWARAFGLFGPVSIVAGAVRGKTEVLSTSIFLEISIGRLEVALAISLLMLAMAFAALLILRLGLRSTAWGTRT